MKDEAVRKEKWEVEKKKKRASEKRAQQQKAREKQLRDTYKAAKVCQEVGDRINLGLSPKPKI